MSTALAICDPESVEVWDLDKLATVANEEYAGLRHDMASGVAHAMAIGEVLEEITRRLPYGKVNEWVIEHFDGGLGAAYRCLRVWRNRELIRAEEIANVSEAMRFLRGKPADTSLNRRMMEAHSSEAKELRAKGLTYAAIGQILDISHTTARLWVNDLKQSNLATPNRSRPSRQTELAEYRRTHAQAKAISKPVADAYSWTRRTAQRLEA